MAFYSFRPTSDTAAHEREGVEETMAKIRHLAIKTKSPERLAAFYEEVFGLERIRSEKGGAIYMSDGYLTLALLRNRGEATPAASIILDFMWTISKTPRRN